MSAITNDVIYEILKSMRTQLAIVREDVDSVKVRLSSLDHRLSLVHLDLGALVRSYGIG